MLASASPIVIPSAAATEVPEKQPIVSRRHGVLLISVFEILGSSFCGILYMYCLAAQPTWARYLVPIPGDLCKTTDIVKGVMYIFVLLCVLELLLALYLFEGARKHSVSRAKFWLSSMLTYLCLVTVVILGLDLGGIRSPSMNSAAFINIFVRFLEILMVYSWTELEGMRRMKARRSHLSGLSRAMSSSTIATTVDTEQFEEIETPPPSYHSTVPNSQMLSPPLITVSQSSDSPTTTKPARPDNPVQSNSQMGQSSLWRKPQD